MPVEIETVGWRRIGEGGAISGGLARGTKGDYGGFCCHFAAEDFTQIRSPSQRLPGLRTHNKLSSTAQVTFRSKQTAEDGKIYVS